MERHLYNEVGNSVGPDCTSSLIGNITQNFLNNFKKFGLKTLPTASNLHNIIMAPKKVKVETITITLKKDTDIRILYNHFVHVKVKDIIKDIFIYEKEEIPKFNWYKTYEKFYGKKIKGKICCVMYLDKMALYKYNLVDIIKNKEDLFGENYQIYLSPLSEAQIHIYSDVEYNEMNVKIIQEVENITLCGIEGINELDKKDKSVALTGKPNMMEIIKLNLHETITSNDMRTIEKYFGIEAANMFIYTSTNNIVNGKIDKRHIRLLADSMCKYGTIMSNNRFALPMRENDVISKNTFEDRVTFLILSVIFREKEDFKSITSCLTFAKRPKIGTGFFDLSYEM